MWGHFPPVCGNRISMDHFDKPIVADTKRLTDRARGIKAKSFRPLPGGRDQPFKLSIGRGPVSRRTGEPWRWS
jgi:hypothetical protein